jgi:hypothetical protein
MSIEMRHLMILLGAIAAISLAAAVYGFVKHKPWAPSALILVFSTAAVAACAYYENQLPDWHHWRQAYPVVAGLGVYLVGWAIWLIVQRRSARGPRLRSSDDLSLAYSGDRANEKFAKVAVSPPHRGIKAHWREYSDKRATRKLAKLAGMSPDEIGSNKAPVSPEVQQMMKKR